MRRPSALLVAAVGAFLDIGTRVPALLVARESDAGHAGAAAGHDHIAAPPSVKDAAVAAVAGRSVSVGGGEANYEVRELVQDGRGQWFQLIGDGVRMVPLFARVAVHGGKAYGLVLRANQQQLGAFLRELPGDVKRDSSNNFEKLRQELARSASVDLGMELQFTTALPGWVFKRGLKESVYPELRAVSRGDIQDEWRRLEDLIPKEGVSKGDKMEFKVKGDTFMFLSNGEYKSGWESPALCAAVKNVYLLKKHLIKHLHESLGGNLAKLATS